MIYYIAKYCHVALENKPLNVQSHTFIDIRQWLVKCGRHGGTNKPMSAVFTSSEKTIKIFVNIRSICEAAAVEARYCTKHLSLNTPVEC